MNTKQKDSKEVKKKKNYENGNFAGILRFGKNGAICRENNAHTHTHIAHSRGAIGFSDIKKMNEL